MTPEYTCLECGAAFDEPKRFTERHGLDTPPYERYSGCPRCGGAFTPTILCDGCNQPIIGEYVQIDAENKNYCDSCYTMRTIGD